MGSESPTEPVRLLLLSSDTNLVSLMRTALRSIGHEVRISSCGDDALRVAQQWSPDIAVLDLTPTDPDSREFARQLQEYDQSIPVILLTPQPLNKRVAGLTVGGGAYLRKPFSVEELMALVRDVLRRVRTDPLRHPDRPVEEVLRVADLELAEVSGAVRRAGQPVQLSPTEFKLLRYLMHNADRVVSRSQILDHVWRYDFVGHRGIVDTYVSHLRRKIDRVEPRLIHTVHGVGYSLRLPGLSATLRLTGRASTVPPKGFTEVFARYANDIRRPGGPLDADTIRAYLSRVGQYLAWLARASVDGDPFGEQAVRDQVVKDYRDWLLTVGKRKPTTVNAHLASVDDFYRHLGLGPSRAQRYELPTPVRRSLDEDARACWLRAVHRAGPRDRALALTEFYAGTRRAETVALDLDDLRMSTRKGNLRVRHAADGTHRVIPMHPELRVALQAWLYERARLPNDPDSSALFLNYRGERLSVRGAYKVLKAIANQAGLSTGHGGHLTPHVLRRTAATTMLGEGKDLAEVAEILGHSVETTRHSVSAPPDE